jgi:hypothetical protein
MSRKYFEAIIGKAIMDPGFRNTLLADPDQALAGYELTEQEECLLKCIDSETIDAMSHILNVRINKIRCSEKAAKQTE